MNEYPTDHHGVQRFNAEVFPMMIRTALAKHSLSHLHVDAEAMLATVADNMVLQLVAYIAGSKRDLVETQENVPLTWWDGFKLAFFSQRLLKRYPAKTRTIVTKSQVIHCCPHVPTEEMSTHISYMMGRPSPMGMWSHR